MFPSARRSPSTRWKAPRRFRSSSGAPQNFVPFERPQAGRDSRAHGPRQLAYGCVTLATLRGATLTNLPLIPLSDLVASLRHRQALEEGEEHCLSLVEFANVRSSRAFLLTFSAPLAVRFPPAGLPAPSGGAPTAFGAATRVKLMDVAAQADLQKRPASSIQHCCAQYAVRGTSGH